MLGGPVAPREVARGADQADVRERLGLGRRVTAGALSGRRGFALGGAETAPGIGQSALEVAHLVGGSLGGRLALVRFAAG
ncbi:MAG TPA: hypothetical protein VJS92_09445, partial [Candidatus Polarisedimenticolaceae bacterium]|nr:hypothetical protein [Candidatus Polarisedimenticolaceae bacterium]